MIVSTQQLRSVTEQGINAEEDILFRLADAAEKIFERETGLRWSAQSGVVITTKVSPGRIRSGRLPVPVAALSAVTKLEVKDVFDSEWREISASSYQVDLESSQVWCRYLEPQARITCSGGYAEGEAPADIVNAILAQVVFWLKRLSQENIAVISKGVADSTTTMLPPAEHPLFRRTVSARTRF